MQRERLLRYMLPRGPIVNTTPQSDGESRKDRGIARREPSCIGRGMFGANVAGSITKQRTKNPNKVRRKRGAMRAFGRWGRITVAQGLEEIQGARPRNAFPRRTRAPSRETKTTRAVARSGVRALVHSLAAHPHTSSYAPYLGSGPWDEGFIKGDIPVQHYVERLACGDGDRRGGAHAALDDLHCDRREFLADGTGRDLTIGRSGEHGGLRRLT